MYNNETVSAFYLLVGMTFIAICVILWQVFVWATGLSSLTEVQSFIGWCMYQVASLVGLLT